MDLEYELVILEFYQRVDDESKHFLNSVQVMFNNKLFKCFEFDPQDQKERRPNTMREGPSKDFYNLMASTFLGKEVKKGAMLTI